MRILSWNCNNGISHESQIEYLRSFSPDLAIIPELKKSNIEKLAPCAAVWITNNHSNASPKGLGILAFNDFQIEELPRDVEMEIFIPLRISKGKFSFNLLAVWNFYWACKQGRFKGLKGSDALELSALEHYKSIFSDPSLIVGDWNLGPTFAQKGFLKIMGVLEQHGIKSLYHEHHMLPLKESQHPTFRSTRKTFHHLDHMLGSRFFYDNMKRLFIDDFANVVRSDHAPLVLDVDIV